MSFVQSVRAFATNKYVNISSAVVLLISSGFEVFEEIDGELDIGVHHGVFLYALVKLIQTLPDLLESAEYLNEGVK